MIYFAFGGYIKIALSPVHMKLKQVPEDFVVRELSAITPEQEGKYTYFALKKRNYTTLRALQQVAQATKTPLSWFGCAGNKDKIAVTEQMCSVASVSPESLKQLTLKDIRLVPVGKGNRPVSLGNLKGNLFEITVRDIDALPAKKTRFINYFGEQRFSTNNAAIGKAMVKRDWKQAVELVLATKSEAAEKMQEALAAEPANYLNALKKAPAKLLKLYIHAFQSLLWNELAKKHAEAHHENVKLPIVGFGTLPDRLLQEVLSREEITPRDFVLKELPALSSEGTERDVFADAGSLNIGALEDDELNPGRKKVKLVFTLPPGSYATEFVRQLFV
jgi:tRNA pseudouridine13 synthase